jgi:TRAP-type C4-dicarboxylate transport system permease small subunit
MWKFIDKLSIVFNKIGLAITLPAITLLITADVFGRKFYKPIVGADEIAGYGLAIMTYAAMSYCWMSDGHISMDLFYTLFKPRLKQIVNALSALIWLIFFIPLFCWLSIYTVPDSFVMRDVGIDSGLPVWPIQSFIALGSFLLCLQLAKSFYFAIRNLIVPLEKK